MISKPNKISIQYLKLMAELIRKDTNPEIMELQYGQPIHLFDGAAVDGRGRIYVPERQITLPGIPVATTVSGRLHLAREFDDFDFRGLDQDLVAQIDQTHSPDLIFKRNGEVYAIRNIYPFGNGLHDKDGAPIRYVSLSIDINFDFGYGLYDNPEFRDWLDAQIDNPETDPGAYQLRFDINQANKLVAQNFGTIGFTDFDRPKRQLVMLSIGGYMAFAAYNEADQILEQSPERFSYDRFGIVGGDKYCDPLTPGATGLLGFVGGRILVPFDEDLLSTIEMRILSPDDYEKLIAATTST